MLQPAPHPKCPFCPANKKVTIIANNDVAYLIAVQRPSGGIMPHSYFIIPKEHIESIFVLPERWWERSIGLVHDIPGIQEDYNISVNVGRKAGQRLLHVHFWILLRDHETHEWPSHELGFAALLELINEPPSGELVLA